MPLVTPTQNRVRPRSAAVKTAAVRDQVPGFSSAVTRLTPSPPAEARALAIAVALATLTTLLALAAALYFAGLFG